MHRLDGRAGRTGLPAWPMNPGGFCAPAPPAPSAAPGTRYQFERLGYFCVDSKDSRPGALVFNSTVGLKDTWAKIQQQPE